jgi:hypothetical protein
MEVIELAGSLSRAHLKDRTEEMSALYRDLSHHKGHCVSRKEYPVPFDFTRQTAASPG